MTHGRRLLGATGAVFSLLVFGCASSATSTATRSSPAPAAASVAAGPASASPPAWSRPAPRHWAAVKEPIGPIDCGDPTPVVLDETPWHTPWAVAGQFRFATYGLYAFQPGRGGAKVLIDTAEPLDMQVSLRGWRCSDGHPLRFMYRNVRPLTFPNVQAMESAGDFVATLEPRGDRRLPVPCSALAFNRCWIDIGSGYMLFTTPGKWTVSVFKGDELIASVVFLVS